jgi:hypothetical protein
MHDKRDVRGLMVVGGLLALTGCATAVPVAGSRFDGPYVGVSTLTRGTQEICGPDRAPDTIAVSAGTFRYTVPIVWVTTVVVQPQLRADGSFDGAAQYFNPEPVTRMGGGHVEWAKVFGRVDGATMDAQVVSGACTRHLSLTRQVA